MDSTTGGQPLDLQRQAAAKIARQKVLATYTDTALRSTDNNARLKDEMVNPKINSESWRRYHTAWQNYYQKYYSEYYATAARNYVEKERLKTARELEEEHEILTAAALKNQADVSRTNARLSSRASASSSSKDPAPAEESFKEKIRRRATESAKNTRRHRHLIPIFAGILTVLLVLFLQYNRLIFAPMMAYVSPGNATASEIEALDPTITKTISPDPKLIIPKLNIDVPIRFDVPLAGVMSAMNNGVAHYRIAGADAYPGQIGNFVITGHSAGDVYSSNPYKYIFSGLERLETGDLIYTNYNSTRYTFRVTQKRVIAPTNVAALTTATDKPLITLVTCTPLGTSKYRLLVTGEQISPAVDTAQPSTTEATVTAADVTALPANEPDFFEGIWNWLIGR